MLPAVTEIPPALARKTVEHSQVSRELMSEQRREQVLERLTAVFAKRGYQAATVDHLIAGAKISMGGFYKEFDGKEDCFIAAYDRVIAELRERLSAAIPPGSDWPIEVALGMRALVEFASEAPMAARVVLIEAQTGGEMALARYGATLAEAADFLRQGREVAGKKRPLQGSIEEATVSGLVWLLQSRLARGRIEDAEELWPNMAKMVLEPYLGAARADQVLRAIN